MINKIFDKTYGKYERKTYIESEIDEFLEKYGDKNIAISYDNNKNKFNTEQIAKSLFVKFEYFKSTKEEGSISPKQKKNEKICKRFKRYC